MATMQGPMGKDEIKELLAAMGKLDSSTVFGQPHVFEGRAVIPVAKISFGGGGGGGTGQGEAGLPREGETEEGSPGKRGAEIHPHGGGSGEGIGLGFGVTAKPLGVIEVTSDGTRWIPTPDAGQIVTMGVVGMVTMGILGKLAMGTWSKTKRHHGWKHHDGMHHAAARHEASQKA
jgi:uncharacterized spore protein YtfJ